MFIKIQIIVKIGSNFGKFYQLFFRYLTYQIRVKLFKFFGEKVQIKTLENRVQFIARIVKICSEKILIFNILHETVSKKA